MNYLELEAYIDKESYESIFIETRRDLVLRMSAYQHLPETIKVFLLKLEEYIILLKKSPANIEILSLQNEVITFKNAIRVDEHQTDPIDSKSVKETKKRLMKMKDEMNSVLKLLSRLRKEIAFGGNFVRAILRRPKLYSDDIDSSLYEITNKNIRIINLAINWAEKALIDTFHMIDQDINIITIVDVQYLRTKIYENVEEEMDHWSDLSWVESYVEEREKGEHKNYDLKKISPQLEEQLDHIPEEIDRYDLVGIIERVDMMTRDPYYERFDDDFDWIEQHLMREADDGVAPQQETSSTKPKQDGEGKKSKNGANRKRLYVMFIEWAKNQNPKNSFGNLFDKADKDIFTNTYPFIPHDLRYFYRLANPILCTLQGNLVFFAAQELQNLNTANTKMNEQLIFAATEEDVRVYNVQDRKIYLGREENETLKLDRALADSFDLYLQQLINKGDILSGSN